MAEKKKSRKNDQAREQKSLTKKGKKQRAGIDIRDKDIRTEIFLGAKLDALTISKAPIKVIHIPTGISAIGKVQGSQIKNRKKAIELLKKKLLKSGSTPNT